MNFCVVPIQINVPTSFLIHAAIVEVRWCSAPVYLREMYDASVSGGSLPNQNHPEFFHVCEMHSVYMYSVCKGCGLRWLSDQ